MNTERAVLLLKMMASPIRLGILKVLAENDLGICVSSIEEILQVAQSSVSQHLAHLRNSGILSCEKKGKKVCYKIIDEAVIGILKSLSLGEE